MLPQSMPSEAIMMSIKELRMSLSESFWGPSATVHHSQEDEQLSEQRQEVCWLLSAPAASLDPAPRAVVREVGFLVAPGRARIHKLVDSCSYWP